MSKIVIALGGNALGNTPEAQLEKAQSTAQSIVSLIRAGNDVIICHGNGPQVGMINLAFEEGAKNKKTIRMPLAECTAMSQGYIGYHLQQAIDAELVSNGAENVPVVTILTQVIVDSQDRAFLDPNKPIGDFYSEEAAALLMEETKEIYVEDSGRGWRKVVASPKPIGIYEYLTLKTLVEDKQVVIAGSGGGVPVIKTDNGYTGVSAVVDKDFTAEKIAELVDADYLLILTAVERVCLDYGKPSQRELQQLSTTEAEGYIKEKQFAAGSMLPKVEACVQFVKSRDGRQAIIASLDKAVAAIQKQSGTLFY